MVRFDEREGLIDEPPREPSGYRHDAASVVPRLLIIMLTANSYWR